MMPNAIPSNEPAVAVILVNWNCWRQTVECLDSLLMQSYRNFHVYVVDNQSADGSVEHIAAWCSDPVADCTWRTHDGVKRWTAQGRSGRGLIPCRIVERSNRESPPPGCRVTLVRAGDNRGFAAGCNLGMQVAGLDSYSFFWLLNTDTIVSSEALSALVARAAADVHVGMVGSTIVYYDSPEVVQCLGGARMEQATFTPRLIGEGQRREALAVTPDIVESQMVYVMGASMLVSREFVRQIGPMEEDYFLYYEEFDWAVRRRDRFALAFASDSLVLHKSKASSAKVKPLFTTRLYYSNRLRFVGRFLPAQAAVVKRGMLVDLVRFTLRGRWGLARIVASILWNSVGIIQAATTDRHSGATKSSYEGFKVRPPAI